MVSLVGHDVFLSPMTPLVLALALELASALCRKFCVADGVDDVLDLLY